jgi:hypothetical protein
MNMPAKRAAERMIKIYDSRKRKKSQTQNHTSKAHSIMQVADRVNLILQLP